MEETEAEEAIPDITPEQETAWNGPGEAPSFDEEDPPCTGYDNACECDNCLMQAEDEFWEEEDADG